MKNETLALCKLSLNAVNARMKTPLIRAIAANLTQPEQIRQLSAHHELYKTIPIELDANDSQSGRTAAWIPMPDDRHTWSSTFRQNLQVSFP